MEKEQEEKLIAQFDRILMDEEYAEAFAFAIDNGIERQALRICIEYVQEDDERTEREMEEQRRSRILWNHMPIRLTLSDDLKLKFEQEYECKYVGDDSETDNGKVVKESPTLKGGEVKIKNPFHDILRTVHVVPGIQSVEFKTEWYEYGR